MAGPFFPNLLHLIVVAAAIVLNLYGMSCGYGIASVFKMTMERRRTLTIEIGMQNVGLGAALALNNFPEKRAIIALPGAIFVFICIITASILAELWQRTSNPDQRQ